MTYEEDLLKATVEGIKTYRSLVFISGISQFFFPHCSAVALL